jgi:hypothetical protein
MNDFAKLMAAMNKPAAETTEPTTPIKETTDDQPKSNTNGNAQVSDTEKSPNSKTETTNKSEPASTSTGETSDQATETSDSTDEVVTKFLASMKDLEEQIPNGEFLRDMMRNVISRIQNVPHIQDFVYSNPKHLETIVSAMHSASSIRQSATFGRRKKAAKKEKNIEMTLDALKDLEF